MKGYCPGCGNVIDQVESSECERLCVKCYERKREKLQKKELATKNMLRDYHANDMV